MHGAYYANSQINIKTLTLNSSLCDYSDVYILAKETITFARGEADAAATQAKRDKRVIFKNCTPFTDYINKIKNTQVNNAKDLDVEMLMYNLIEYSDNYSRRSENLWQYYRDEPTDTLANSELFKFKEKIIGKTPMMII